ARLLQVPLAQAQKTLTTRYRTAAQARAGAPANLVLNLNIRLPGEAPPPAAEAAADAAADGGDETLDEPDSSGQRPIKYAAFKELVSQDVYEKIRKLGVRGVYGDYAFRREYPDNELAAHLIGFVNSREEPANGIENYANFFLSGQNGWV